MLHELADSGHVLALVEGVALMLFDKLKAYGWMTAAIAAGSMLAVQSVRLHTEQRARLLLITSTAQQETARTQAALKQEQRTSALETTHATASQGLSDAFTQTQPARDDSRRTDIARADRLRLDADRRAATYRAQANADATVRRGLADRLEALDRQLVEGVGVVGELRGVVAKRDAEVVLLRGTIDADRALLAP